MYHTGRAEKLFSVLRRNSLFLGGSENNLFIFSGSSRDEEGNEDYLYCIAHYYSLRVHSEHRNLFSLYKCKVNCIIPIRKEATKSYIWTNRGFILKNVNMHSSEMLNVYNSNVHFCSVSSRLCRSTCFLHI